MINEEWDKMTAPEYMQFTRKWIGACHNVLKDNGSIYISCTYHNLGEVMIVLRQFDFKINNIITSGNFFISLIDESENRS